MTNVRGPAPMTTLPTTPADLSDEQLQRRDSFSRPSAPATTRTTAGGRPGPDTLDHTRPTSTRSSTPTPASGATVSRGETVTPQLVSDLKKLVSSMGPLNANAAQLGDVDFAVAPGVLFPTPSVEQAEAYRQMGTIMASGDLYTQARLCAGISALYANGIYAQQADAQTVFSLPYETVAANLQPAVEWVASASTTNPTWGPAATDTFAGVKGPGDINDIVQWVLREGYLENMEDLKYYAQKVRQYNEMKKAVRDHLTQLRKIQATLAGVKDEDKAKTNLAGGSPNGATGAGGTLGGNTVAGLGTGDPNVSSPEDRMARFPEQHAAVAEFMGLCDGNIMGRTRLEDYLDKNPDARARFLAAIPYMSTGELTTALRHLFGQDTILCDGLKGMFAQIAAAMTPHQVLDFAKGADAERAGLPTGWAGAVFNFQALTGGEFANVFAARLSTTKAQVQAKTGNTSNDLTELLNSYNGLLADQKKAAEEAKAAEELEAAEAAQAAADAQAEQEAGSVVAMDTDIDVDPSDGAIDGTQPTAEPPYLMKSGDKIDTVAKLETEIKNLEEKLNGIGDDAQLANVDLQNMLQKQQQTLQMMSNMSKMLHDTALSIIRKIGG